MLVAGHATDEGRGHSDGVAAILSARQQSQLAIVLRRFGAAAGLGGARLLRASTYLTIVGFVIAIALMAASYQKRASTDWQAESALTSDAVHRIRFMWAAATQDPIGVGALVSGHAASLLGALAVSVIAAVNVAGEWTTGTVGVILARDPRRVRFVIRRFLFVLFAGVAVVLAAWVMIALLGPLYRALYDVPAAAQGFSTVSARAFAKAVFILGMYSALGTLAGVIVRRPLGAFGLSGAFVAGTLLASRFEALCPGLPSCWVTTVMEYQREEAMARHVWISGSSAVVGPTLAWAAISGFAIACLVAAAWYMERTDV